MTSNKGDRSLKRKWNAASKLLLNKFLNHDILASKYFFTVPSWLQGRIMSQQRRALTSCLASPRDELWASKRRTLASCLASPKDKLLANYGGSLTDRLLIGYNNLLSCGLWIWVWFVIIDKIGMENFLFPHNSSFGLLLPIH